MVVAAGSRRAEAQQRCVEHDSEPMPPPTPFAAGRAPASFSAACQGRLAGEMAEGREMNAAERGRLEAELARARENPVSLGQALRTAAAMLAPWLWKPAIALLALDGLVRLAWPAAAEFALRVSGGLALVVAGGAALL